MNGLSRLSCLKTGLFLALALMAAPYAQAGGLTLAVANSTCVALQKVGDLYRARHPIAIDYLCKSSGLLAKGLLGGALSADIFISADQEWMDFAVDNGLVVRDQVTSPWGNTLVVAAPKASPLGRLAWPDLASDKVTRILIGDPSNAPFGRYTKDALEATGLWDRVKHKIETRKNIELLAESLAQADSGTVGILFATHVRDPLRPLHIVKGSLHQPIRYYAAPLKTAAANAEAAAFLKFIHGKAARRIFKAEGFVVGAP
jgi:molybdate transport system substrate-binding protein